MKLGNYNVLIVEDNVNLGFGIQYSLSKEGMKADTAKNLKLAREKMSSKNYDIIILDVMLPDGRGFEFCEELRKTSNIPVIFLTACDEEFDVIRGLDMADDYITKPFKLYELISRIKSVMRRYAQPAQKTSEVSSYSSNNVIMAEDCECLVSEDICLDKLKARVYKNNEEILLTPIEYKLINMLMNNPFIVIKRERIYDILWDNNGESVGNKTLQVHMSRLREKLRASSPDYYIETVRGLGYRWNRKVFKGDRHES